MSKVIVKVEFDVKVLWFPSVSDYIEASVGSSDSMLLGIMMRFKTLSSTNQLLTDTLASKTDEVCSG